MDRRYRALCAPMLGCIVVALASSGRAHAEDPDQASKRERCATRLSIALLGQSPTAALLDPKADPAGQVDGMIASPEFAERFANFVNASFNREPGMTEVQDAAYVLSKDILSKKRPWKDLFTGPFEVDDDDQGKTLIRDDPNGLGIYRSYYWMKRYAGNELSGLRIRAAYRILSNTVGLKLVATTIGEDTDVSATGRAKPACAGCHFQNWYALDKVASILSRRVGTGEEMTFAAPTNAEPHQIAGKAITDDKQLLDALVTSDAYRVHQCRLVFRYVYGREENQCEGAIFDKCVDAFGADGMIQSAVAAVVKDPSFCQ